MGFQRLARVEEIPPGQTMFLCRQRGPILLANVAGRIYALSGICPHQQNPLDGAVLWGHLVDCPWHHFQFDVRTGENYFPSNVYPEDMPQLEAQVAPLATYAVEVREGEIWVDVE